MNENCPCILEFLKTVNLPKGLRASHMWKTYDEVREPPIATNGTSIFEHQYLLPWEIGTYFHQHVLGTTYESSTNFFLVSLTRHFMSLWQNQNSYSTLLVEWYFFFNFAYVGAEVPCLPILTLDVTQNPCIGLHHPTSLGKIGWQYYNVPMGRRAVDF